VYPLQVPDPSDDLLAAAMLDQQPLDSAPAAIREIMEALPRAFPITVWHTIHMARQGPGQTSNACCFASTICFDACCTPERAHGSKWLCLSGASCFPSSTGRLLASQLLTLVPLKVPLHLGKVLPPQLLIPRAPLQPLLLCWQLMSQECDLCQTLGQQHPWRISKPCCPQDRWRRPSPVCRSGCIVCRPNSGLRE
jgi:hypothetical protein